MDIIDNGNFKNVISTALLKDGETVALVMVAERGGRVF